MDADGNRAGEWEEPRFRTPNKPRTTLPTVSPVSWNQHNYKKFLEEFISKYCTETLLKEAWGGLQRRGGLLALSSIGGQPEAKSYVSSNYLNSDNVMLPSGKVLCSLEKVYPVF